MGQPYSLSIQIPPTNFVAAFPLCEIICTATDHVAITELYADVYVNAACTIVLGFGRPAAAGTSPLLPQIIVPDNGGNSAGVFLSAVTQWTKPPTAPTVYNRRATLNGPATGHGEARWYFDPGFVIVPSGTAVVWCIAAGTSQGNITGDVTFSVDL